MRRIRAGAVIICVGRMYIMNIGCMRVGCLVIVVVVIVVALNSWVRWWCTWFSLIGRFDLSSLNIRIFFFLKLQRDLLNVSILSTGKPRIWWRLQNLELKKKCSGLAAVTKCLWGDVKFRLLGRPKTRKSRFLGLFYDLFWTRYK